MNNADIINAKLRLSDKGEKECYELLKSYADQCLLSPISLLEAFVHDCDIIAKGKRDTILYNEFTIEQVRQYKQSKELYGKLANNLLRAHNDVREYLLATGQFKETIN